MLRSFTYVWTIKVNANTVKEANNVFSIIMKMILIWWKTKLERPFWKGLGDPQESADVTLRTAGL